MADTDKIQFHYIKSNHFRVIHSDGAWGGVTPDGNLFIAFYSQRPPIPEVVVHGFRPDGKLGEAIKDAGTRKSGIVREVETGIVLSGASVDNLIEWLVNQKKSLARFKELSLDASSSSRTTDSTDT